MYIFKILFMENMKLIKCIWKVILANIHYHKPSTQTPFLNFRRVPFCMTWFLWSRRQYPVTLWMKIPRIHFLFDERVTCVCHIPSIFIDDLNFPFELRLELRFIFIHHIDYITFSTPMDVNKEPNGCYALLERGYVPGWFAIIRYCFQAEMHKTANFRSI